MRRWLRRSSVPVALAAASGVLLASALSTASGDGLRDTSGPFAVGRPLRIDDSGPVMQPMRLPATSARLVSVRPGSAGVANQEAWAAGWTTAPSSRSGYANNAFQGAFFHHTRSGWEEAGPPTDSDGSKVAGVNIIAMSIAANGEGWAEGRPRAAAGGNAQNDVVLHHVPGRPGPAWVTDDTATAAFRAAAGSGLADAVSISIASPSESGGGTYGFALIGESQPQSSNKQQINPQGQVLRLDPSSNQWVQDGTLTGPASAIATVSSTEAWAVGSPYQLAYEYCATGPQPGAPQTCADQARGILSSGGNYGSVVYHRTGTSWTSTPPNDMPYAIRNGSATSVAADASGAWIGGLVGLDQPPPVPETLSVSAPPNAPFIMKLSGSGDAAYCDPSVSTVPGEPHCGGGFPSPTGTVWTLGLAPAAGSGSTVFAAVGDNGPNRLFNLSRGAGDWREQPTTATALSMSFASPDEGWVAGGDTIGHWTTFPDHPMSRRWPTPTAASLSGVAEDPGGSGTVMAVGDWGIGRLDPSTGLWTDMPVPPGTPPLTSISWPRPNDAWAVGGRTVLHYDGHSWSTVPVQGTLGGDLRSVAVMAQPIPALPQRAAAVNSSAELQEVANVGASPDALDSWGGNKYGQLGIGATTPALKWTASSVFPSGIIAVAAGGAVAGYLGKGFSLAIACLPACTHVDANTQAGTIYAWGDNDSGQLGIGSTTSTSVPKAISTPDGAGGGFVAVSAGTTHSLAVGANGSLWAWGSDSAGQLGTGQNGTSTTVPVQVMDPTTNAPYADIVAVSAGENFSLALRRNGNVLAWGNNAEGELGQGTSVPRSSSLPLQVQLLSASTHTPIPASQVAAGAQHALALTAEGVYAWGNDSSHQVSSPCTGGTSFTGCPPAPVSSLPASTPTAIAAKGDISLAVFGGDVYQWGIFYAQSGSTTTITTASPTKVSGLPGRNTVQVSAGWNHDAYGNTEPFAVAAAGDGSVWAWGDNTQGELGADPSTLKASASAVPIASVSLDNPASLGRVAAGADHVLAAVSPTSGSTSPPASPPPSPGPAGGPGGALQGYAVGDHGTALRFDGQQWVAVPTPTSATLRSVAATGRDFVAVGDGGVLLVDGGSGWATVTLPPESGKVDPNTGAVSYPILTAVAGLPDGTALAAGAGGVLLERGPSDGALSFRLDALPLLGTADLDGYIRALAAGRDNAGRLHVLASVGEADPPGHFSSGWLMAGDEAGWHDAELAEVGVAPSAAGASDYALDSYPVHRSAVAAALLGPGGTSGWAVGTDGAVWRVQINQGDPGAADFRPNGADASPMEAHAVVTPTADSLASFAYLANTGCMQGFCAGQLGWGTRGDVIATEALRAIDQSARAGGVGFLAGGGDVRRSGDDPSLGAIQGLLDSLSIPAFEAVGAKDLTTNGTTGSKSSSLWQSVFGARPAPWGNANGARPGITPVADPLGGSAGSKAATHYAFDYSNGAIRVRIAVLDTSQNPTSLAANDTNQNPQEDQLAWLTALLQKDTTVPVIVVMNQPAVITAASNAGDGGLTTLLSQSKNVLGVLSSAQSPNQVFPVVNGGVPVYMFAGGGGLFETSALVTPPGQHPITDPLHGYYFSWQLVSVGLGQDGVTPTLTVHSVPVLGSMAMTAPQGTSVALGHAIRLGGAGRIPDVGTFNDNGQGISVATPSRLSFPFPKSLPAGVVPPDYHFTSSDTVRLVPVKEGPDGHPLKAPDGVHTIYDESSGLYCANGVGTIMAQVNAGNVAAQLPVTVVAGSGTECGPTLPPPAAVKHVVPVVKPPLVQPVPPQPAPPGPAHVVVAPPHYHVRFNAPPQAVGAVAPPPAEVVPAPPGGIGQAAGQKEREEESEAATEDANMTALRAQRHEDPDWLPIGAAALGIGLAGYCIARGRRRRAGPVRAAVVTNGAWRGRDR